MHPTDPMARFLDLQKQGFMKPLKAKRVAKERPIVACQACMDWHRQGKHSKSKAERAALKAKENGK